MAPSAPRFRRQTTQRSRRSRRRRRFNLTRRQTAAARGTATRTRSAGRPRSHRTTTASSRRRRRPLKLPPVFIYLASLAALLGMAVFSLLLWAAVPWARELNNPPWAEVADPPESWSELNYRGVQFRGRPVADVSGPTAEVLLQGWYLAADDSNKSVILLHDHGQNRHLGAPAAFDLAPQLVEAGYHVLMVDLRNHGRSQSAATTMGQNEIADVAGAVAYLAGMGPPGENIALLGIGLGGTTGLLAAEHLPEVKAVIAEGSYTSVDDLLAHQLTLTPRLPNFLPHYPFHLLLKKLTLRLAGIKPQAVDARQAVGQTTKPIFLIHGQADAVVPTVQGSTLAAAAGGAAELWLVPAAGHGEAFSTVPAEYVDRLLTFLSKHLAAPTGGN